MPNEVPQENLLQGLARGIPLALAAATDIRTGRGQSVPLVQSLLPPTPEEQMLKDLQVARVRQQIDSDKLRSILGFQRLEMQGQELDAEQVLNQDRQRLGESLFPGKTPQDQLARALIGKGQYGPVFTNLTKENKTPSHLKKLKAVQEEKEFVDMSLSPGFSPEDIKRAANTELNIREMSVSDAGRQIIRFDQTKTDELQRNDKIDKEGASTERRKLQYNYIYDLRKQFAAELDSLSSAELELITEFISRPLQNVNFQDLTRILNGTLKRRDLKIPVESPRGLF